MGIQGKKILIVDDNDLNIFALSAALKTQGPILSSVKDGKECLDYIKENPNVDLILLDMMMPVMDGYETLKWLKNDDSFKSIPVIALTAQAMNGDLEKCLEAGANDYCSKPVDIHLLFVKINDLICS